MSTPDLRKGLEQEIPDAVEVAYDSPGLGFASEIQELGKRLMDALEGQAGTWFLGADSKGVRVYRTDDEYATGMVMRFGTPGIQIQSQFGGGSQLVLAVKPDGRVVQGDAYDPERIKLFLTADLLTS